MFDFTLDATSGPARAGTLTLPHGTVETPVFMPVGTQGTVRALSPNDLRNAGATLVLANTYHLHVRPGEQVVRKPGARIPYWVWVVPRPTIRAASQRSRRRDSARRTTTAVGVRSPGAAGLAPSG